MVFPRFHIHPTVIGAPLSSIIAALGMWLTGQINFTSARLFFILIAAIVPPLTAALAYTFSQRRDLAIASGLLAIFSVYHAPFVGVTDNFSPFMLFGGLYFLVVTQLIQGKNPNRNWLLLGILSGLMTLSRSDGLLWLALTFLFALWRAKPSNQPIFNLHPSSFIFHSFPPRLPRFPPHHVPLVRPQPERLWLDHGSRRKSRSLAGELRPDLYLPTRTTQPAIIPCSRLGSYSQRQALGVEQQPWKCDSPRMAESYYFRSLSRESFIIGKTNVSNLQHLPGRFSSLS